MIKIPECLVDDYIHASKLKNFCFEHEMTVSDGKTDLLKKVIEYAGEDQSSDAYKETYTWFLDTIKAGSKELCLKKVYVPDETLENVEQLISSKYKECPFKDVLSFRNLDGFSLVNYEIKNNEQGIVSKVSFLFSRMVLEGEKELERGHKIIYPLYIDLYTEEGFIVARYKPKTTIYQCSEEDIIYKENRFKPLDEAVTLIGKVEKVLRLQDMDINPRQKFCRMMYKLYQKYSFTPENIQSEIDRMESKRNNFVNEIFGELKLKDINKAKAKIDLNIFLEKYISINGDMEKVFKEDRDAYLIKITSDDDLQMTRIDTASIGNRPLQCSDTFFDGKKSILNTQECRVLHLCYNRRKGYLGPFTVQLTTKKECGLVKMYYVPEEEDIHNVLQTIFENY